MGRAFALLLVACAASSSDLFYVARWPRDAFAAISLTFDDGKVASLGANAELLDLYALKGTFYVVAGYLDGSSPHVAGGGADPAVTRALSRKRLRDGHEIGCHSVSHVAPLVDATLANATREIDGCAAAFAMLFKGEKRAGATMAYPWGTGAGDVRGRRVFYFYPPPPPR